jgi:hypothetical protein
VVVCWNNGVVGIKPILQYSTTPLPQFCLWRLS